MFFDFCFYVLFIFLAIYFSLSFGFLNKLLDLPCNRSVNVTLLRFRYIVTFAMIYYLNKRVVLLPPKFGELQFGSYLKSGE